MAKIEMVVRLVASEWATVKQTVRYEKGDVGTRIRLRVWNQVDANGSDTAAEVVQPPGSIWPFSRYEWNVFAPFHDECVESGSSFTLQGAMDEADAVLRKLAASIAEDAPQPSA